MLRQLYTGGEISDYKYSLSCVYISRVYILYTARDFSIFFAMKKSLCKTYLYQKWTVMPIPLDTYYANEHHLSGPTKSTMSAIDEYNFIQNFNGVIKTMSSQ